MTDLTPADLMDDDRALFGEEFLEEPAIMTKEQIEALLAGLGSSDETWTYDPEDSKVRERSGHEICWDSTDADGAMIAAAPDIARTAIALHQQLADAQAAAALVVELCADEFATHPAISAHFYADTPDQWRWRVYEHIMSLADPSGVVALAALRAERDAFRIEGDRLQTKAMGAVDAARAAEAERDALAAKLAAAEARVGALTEAGKALRDALGDLLAAYSKPDDRLCCGGQDCGCQGATIYQQAEYYANSALAVYDAAHPHPRRGAEGMTDLDNLIAAVEGLRTLPPDYGHDGLRWKIGTAMRRSMDAAHPQTDRDAALYHAFLAGLRAALAAQEPRT